MKRTSRMLQRSLVISLFLFLCAAIPAGAAVISWTDWTSATPGSAGSAVGTIYGGTVGVTYDGEIAFAQLGNGVGDLNNYWTEPNPLSKPYTGNSVVSNAPTPVEMIATNLSDTTRSITFTAPVLNPILAIVSLGQLGLPVTYDFDQPFTVLSEGQGFWGDGSYTLGSIDTLTGREFHGVLQFSGLISSINWSSAPDEYWHGITVGAPVPEPGTMMLLGSGLIGLAGWGRKKFRK